MGNDDRKGGMIFRNGFGFARIDEFLSEKLPKNAVKINKSPEAKADTKEAKSEMEIKNAAELEREYPEIVSEIRNSALISERERLKTLDSLNASGCEEIIARAKYEDPKDARDIAVEILQKMNAQAQLNALHNDAKAVDPALPPERNTPDEKAEESRIIDMIAGNINAMRGYK